MNNPDRTSASSSEFLRVHADAARRFVTNLLTAKGLPAADATTMAACLIRADLRGVDTHGIIQLPGYFKRLGLGLINPNPDLYPKRITPVAAHLDGDNGFGYVVASRGMAESIAMADEFGIGLTSVHRSTHFGMAASYLLQAVERGFIAFVFTNASRAMPPWGGREAFLGTSPFAVGVPGGRNGAFILDMAPSIAARGKIRKALRQGEKIPEGYALDEHGRPTTDPAEALKGVVLPIGGPKGSGLSMLMDVLGGVLSGAAFAGNVGDQYKNFDRPQNVGHFLLALKPGLFVGDDAFRDRMDTLAEEIHGNPRADGVSEILMPGEPESRREAERLANGITYRRADIAAILAEASTLGLSAIEELG